MPKEQLCQGENSKSEEANKVTPQEQTFEQPQTKNMEVHHHPNLHHRKKHWKEYLLEFLMIFLAVTLGFFAESYREHLGDRTKEKQYMYSMLADLQKDTASMNISVRSLMYTVKGHDSLETMLGNAANKNDFEFYRKLYYMNTVFTWDDINPVFTESTITELKNSGNLRLIENNALTDSILDYEGVKRNGDEQHDYVRESISKTYFFATDIFDISYYRKYNDFLNSADYENRVFIPYEKVQQYIGEKPQLLSNDASLIKKYNRLVNNEKDQLALYLFYVEDTRQTAIRLIQQIKTEYHFQ